MKATLALADEGFAIVDGFLPLELVAILRGEILSLRKQGLFRRAGVGQGERHQVNDKVRRDEVHWLDPENLTAPQEVLWERLRAFQSTLNRELFLGLQSFEGHYAIYPPGAFYQKHVDRFESDSKRTISCVIYLNEKWNARDGGELCLYGQREVKVLPLPGRLVCFVSDQLPHEVLPTQQERLSFTGWFKR